MPAAIAIPLIAAGIGGGVSIYNAHKARSQAQPLLDAEGRLAQQQGDQSRQLFNLGFPNLQKASGYYGSLLAGNRASVNQTLAPTVAHISDVYKGASRNLGRLPAGPERDEATADLNRQRAAQIGGLPAMARSDAAQQVMNIGSGATGQGISATGGAAGIYSSLLGSQLEQQKFSADNQEALGKNLSGLITQFVNAWRNKNSPTGTNWSDLPTAKTEGSYA